MIITVTGRPGSGKTTFAKFLGLPIISADDIGKEILPQIQTELVEEFGDEILNNGNIESERLAEEAFRNKESVSKLNEISHPVLINKIQQDIQKYEDVVIDAALYHELELDKISDVTILINCNRPFGGEKLLKRSAFQTPVDGADFVVENNGSLEQLKTKAEELWMKIKK